MGDISTWSPVDESNTMAPPNGWPEGQATNTVNNCARALMGGVRRWYDTVTAQLASLSTSVSDRMPIAGGTFTGAITAPSVSAGLLVSTGNLDVQGLATVAALISNNDILASGIISASGTVSGGALGTTGSLNVQGGATINGSVTTGYLQASSLNVPNVATVGEVTCTGNINAAGWINCAEYRLFGVPVVMMSEDDFAALEARITALERRGALEPA